MSIEVDYYDVQNIHCAILEVREEVNQRFLNIGKELDAIERVLNARTERLA